MHKKSFTNSKTCTTIEITSNLNERKRMEEVDVKELYRLLNKYKAVISQTDKYEVMNDLEYVIFSVRNLALDKFNLILKEEND